MTLRQNQIAVTIEFSLTGFSTDTERAKALKDLLANLDKWTGDNVTVTVEDKSPSRVVEKSVDKIAKKTDDPYNKNIKCGF